MNGRSQPPKSDQNSIKYRCGSLRGATSELADFSHEEYAPDLSDNKKQSYEISEPVSSKLLSTAELVSAAGQIWKYASHPLAVLQPEENLKENCNDCQKEDIVRILGKGKDEGGPTSADTKHFSVDLRTNGRISPMAQPNLGFLKADQKISVFKPWSEDCTHSFLWRFIRNRTNMPNDCCKGKGLISVEMPCELGRIYGWMTEIIPAGLKAPIISIEIENRNTSECCIQTDKGGPSETIISEDATSTANNLAIGSADLYPNLAKSNDLASCDNSKHVVNPRGSRSLNSDYFLGAVQYIEADASVSRTPSSSLYAEYHVNSSASCGFEESEHSYGDGELLEKNKRNQSNKDALEDEAGAKICLPACDKPRHALAKQEHAFAGAMAGLCVSLCLHPVDTVKTVIQSCRADQKSICYMGRSIVSERGLTGLYRGISSNIASSAPISAVYTFTYESVKGALLPIFPKEYQSFAHCVAGGCASVATSFIFTPSERIKQQMQVGSHYQNCWNALVGIIEKGGLRSLYTGWGAVLCRNVPHSIIKFYAYESLKEFMLSSPQSNAQTQPSTLQTLVCGGLAGSTAAVFTTPFDVVKTRLQTQIPGSVSQYNSVFHAIQEIGKHEGLKGLYRGLTPRLIMYMSQGALFFTSYEFFKRLFASEVPQFSTKTIQYKQNMLDDSETIPSSLSSSLMLPPPPPPPPRLLNKHSLSAWEIFCVPPSFRK